MSRRIDHHTLHQTYQPLVHVPSPADRATSQALPDEVAQQLARVESGLMASSSQPDAPLVIYISKMIAVPASLIPRCTPGEGNGSDGCPTLISAPVFIHSCDLPSNGATHAA